MPVFYDFDRQNGVEMGKLICDFRVVGPVQTNCYFFYDEETSECVLVDPGDSAGKIKQYIEQKGLKPTAILLTHGHFDHILAVKELKESYDVTVYAAEEEKEVLKNTGLNLSGQMRNAVSLEADYWLKDGEELDLLGQQMRCILTPGHTKGGMCFYFPKAGVLFSGDTLFEESVGRTDFPTGSMSTLIRSIREKLFVLPPAVQVYPGHGMKTSIENEKLYNPFAAL